MLAGITSLTNSGHSCTRNTESFTVCPAYDGVCVVMSGVMMGPGSDGSDLGGIGLISCLIPFDLIRKWATTLALWNNVPV